MATLDNEDKRTLVKQYVKATGLLKGAWLVAGCSRSGFFDFLKENPAFREELEKIKRYSDPSLNANLIEAAHNAVEQNLLHGAFKKISDVNPETGKAELKRIIESGASKWAIEMILTQPSYTEAALNMIVSTQMKSIADDDTLSDDMKQAFFAFLADFRQQELIELIKRGKPVKDDLESR
jgi:hypothetical protein